MLSVHFHISPNFLAISHVLNLAKISGTVPLTVSYLKYFCLADFPVRLSGSSLPSAGTIEVMYHGVWGGVVRHGIDITAGHVVCRQLGYSGAHEIFYRSAFGQVQGPLFIWRIQCHGNETKISDCAVKTWDNVINPHPYDQDPTRAPGVLCNEANSTTSKGSYRL